MKYVLFVFTAFFYTGCLTLELGERFTPGVFQGTASGYRGQVAVSVETDAFSIVDIEIIEQHEDAWPGGEAIRELLELVLDEGSTDIDVVTGATISSNAFLYAVNNALDKAQLRK